MNIEMLTTSFPKFPADSHSPWILAMGYALLNNSSNKVKVITPSANDLKRTDNFSGVQVIRFRYMLKPFEQVAYGANIPSNVKNNKIAKISFPFFVVGFFIAAARLYKGDIVHAQFGYSGVFCALAKFIFRKKAPLIISFYGRDLAHSFKHPKIYNFAFKQAKKILVLSEDMKTGLIKSGCPTNKIIVHHLGVDLTQFNAPNREKKTNKHIVILVVANFVAKKGIDLGIRAFAEMLDKLSDYNIQLRLVGRGPEEAKYRNLIEKYKLKQHVVFLNNYLTSNPRQTVTKEMAGADIFMLPSVPVPNDYGGTPVVLMEASAMKLPVITTDDAGNSEIILNEKTGFVTKPNHINELVYALQRLVTDKELRIKFGKAGHQHIAREFNHHRQMQTLETIYENIIN